MDTSTRLSGENWQKWVDKLLVLHCGSSNYQKVPDDQRGDAGIDGFCLSTFSVFQAYGPEEPLTTRARYEKQRNKITTDIKKFIDNKDIIHSILGNMKVKRWILVVPKFDARELLIHAKKKAEEVIQANLLYVDADFEIVIHDEGTYELECNKLLGLGLGDICIQSEEVSSDRVLKWADESELINNLELKISRLPNLGTSEKKEVFRDDIIRAYLVGQNLMDEMRKYPLEYEKIVDLKNRKARYLNILTTASDESNNKLFTNCYTELRGELRNAVPSVENSTIDELAMGTVSEWMITCPLDFK